jgi:hypothetical protein
MNEAIETTGSETFDDALRSVNAEEAAAHAVGAVAAILGQAAAAQQAIEGQQLEDDIPVQNQFFSLGHVCQLLNRPPSDVRALMRRAGVQIAYCVNEVVHLDGAGVVKLNRLAREDAECRQN